MASKLIFSKSWEQLAKQFANWNQGSNDNPIYYSIAFTDDGYLATHGKRFKLTNADGGDGAGGALSLAGNVLTYTDALGIAHNVTLPLIQAKGEDGNPVAVSTADSVATIKLNTISGLAESATFGASSATSITVPKITVDQYGRITAAQNATAVAVDKITQTAVSGETGKYYLLGRKQDLGDATTLADSVYNKDVYYNGSALVAPALAEGSELLSSKYVKLSDAFDKSGDAYQFTADDSHRGTVYLTDSYISTVTNTAASPKAVDNALTAAKSYANELFATNDAMIFAGTINAAGELVSKNSALSITATNIADVTGKSGWTFKFENAGTISINGVSHNYEAGDMLVCTSDDKKISQGGWTIIQANIDGAVTAADAFAGIGLVVSTGAGRSVSLFNYPGGQTAKILKATSAGLTWADDIDTHRTVKVGTTIVCSADDVQTALNFVAGDGIEIIGTEGAGTVTIKNTSALSSALALSILANSGDSVGTYNPFDTALSLKAGAGLEAVVVEGAVEFKHSNNIAAQTTAKLGAIKYDAQGHITGFSEVTALKNPYALTIGNNTDKITYDGSAAMALDIVGSGDLAITKSVTASGITYTGSLTHKYKAISIKNGTETQATAISGNTASAITLVGGNNVTLSKDGDNNLKIAATNTWRNVSAYTLTGTSSSEVLNTSVGTADLAFGNEFIWSSSANDAAGEIKLVWTEIGADGTITYQA